MDTETTKRLAEIAYTREVVMEGLDDGGLCVGEACRAHLNQMVYGDVLWLCEQLRVAHAKLADGPAMPAVREWLIRQWNETRDSVAAHAYQVVAMCLFGEYFGEAESSPRAEPTDACPACGGKGRVCNFVNHGFEHHECVTCHGGGKKR